MITIANIRSQNPTAAARYGAIRDNYSELFSDAESQDHRGRTTNSGNSYSAELVTAFLTEGAITTLQNRWAPLLAFTRDFSVDPFKPLAVGEVKHVTAGPTVLATAPSTPIANFESGDATVAAVTITPQHYSAPIHVSSYELNSGLRMENMMTIAVAKLADAIIEAAMAPITLANFATSWGSGNVITAADFGFSTMATLWGKLKKSPIKNALLDGEYLAKLLNQPTYFQAVSDGAQAYRAFGWDLIALNTDWTGASNNAVGFVCNPQAILCIAGMPVTPAAPNLTQGSFTVPGINIGVQTNQWFSLATRTAWYSFDLVFGAAKADTSAGILICSS